MAGQQFPKNITDKIFYLYKNYILEVNEDIAWCLSILLKDQELENEQIEWLVENCSKNDYVLNRLLKYPKENILIENWANMVLDTNEYDNRQSEIYGILIKKTIPEKVKYKDTNNLVWGIYYSKSNNEIKKKLLIESANYSNLRSVTEICYRLNIPEVLVSLIRKIKENTINSLLKK